MDDLRNLFDSYIDGDLSPDDWVRLEGWISASDENAREFIRWCATQADIFDLLRCEGLQEVLRDSNAGMAVAGDAAADPSANAAAKPSAARAARDALFNRLISPRLYPTYLSAAALLFIMVGVFAILNRTGGPEIAGRARLPESSNVDDTQLAAGVKDDEPAPFVATLTQLVDGVWSETGQALENGQHLVAGTRVALKSGLARVTFDSGAEVVLEGPCEFIIDSAMRASVKSGSVSATVPRRAWGFRIRAPNAEIIDLGTKFGVSVSDSRQAEVHVFKGEVISRRINADGSQPGQAIRLAENDAIQFGARGLEPSRFEADAAKFVREVSLGVPAERRAILPASDDLALWLAADMSVETDQQGRAVAWRDVVWGDNEVAEDALQSNENARPVLVRDAIGGLPALRFDGNSDHMVTTPLETTDDQTILVVCKFNPGSQRPDRKLGGQILNYNGPPHRFLSTTYEPGVLQLGEPVAYEFVPTQLDAHAYAGKDSGTDIAEGRVTTEPVGVDEPVVVAYVYDTKRNKAELFVNGEKRGEATALAPVGIVSRKVIGRHGFMNCFFDGDLAEVLIFNAAISPEQLNAMTEYLGEKYSIDVVTTAD